MRHAEELGRIVVDGGDAAGAFHRQRRRRPRPHGRRLRYGSRRRRSHTENARRCPPGPATQRADRPHAERAQRRSGHAGRNAPVATIRTPRPGRPDGRRRPKLARNAEGRVQRDRGGADASADIASERAASPGGRASRKTCTTSAIARIPTESTGASGSEAGILCSLSRMAPVASKAQKALLSKETPEALASQANVEAQAAAAASRQSASGDERCASSTPSLESFSTRRLGAALAARRWRSTVLPEQRTRSSTPSSKRSSRGSHRALEPRRLDRRVRKLAHGLPAPRARAPERISAARDTTIRDRGSALPRRAVRARAARGLDDRQTARFFRVVSQLLQRSRAQRARRLKEAERARQSPDAATQAAAGERGLPRLSAVAAWLEPAHFDDVRLRLEMPSTRSTEHRASRAPPRGAGARAKR